jgi:uncharacterized lipoprotein YddW (UPF0748 family)
MWAHATQAKTRAEAEALLDETHAAGVDALYMLVWYWGGQAYYVTDLAPLAKDVQPGFNPLGYLVAGAHQRGMQIHAWFVNGEVGGAGPGVALEKHPDWAMVDAAGNRTHWYDLGQSEVRQFESDLMIDVLKRYEVDGVHFDYIRHDGRDTCYCDRCQAAFGKQTGMKPADYRPDAIPCALQVSANPLDSPTTAKVLARFSNGVPAVYLNDVGRGQVLGLNYHADGLSQGFARTAVQRFLQGADVANGIPLLWPPETAKDYARSMPEAFAAALAGLGYQTRIVGDLAAGTLPAKGAVALVCAYRVPEASAVELLSWVEGGGKLVLIDGPVFSMNLEPMKRLTGMAKPGGYFYGQMIVRPEAKNELLPLREREVDIDALARFGEAWAQFQRQGPTALVRDVHRRTKELRPKAYVTAAVFLNREAADSVYQDWYGWLKEGIVDYVIPMCYVMDSRDLERDLDEWLAADPKLERIVPGLSIYQQAGGQTTSRPPELVLDQVSRCLKRGAHGTVFFSAHYLDAPLTAALAGLKRP